MDSNMLNDILFAITVWIAIICCTTTSVARRKYSQPRPEVKNCTINIIDMEKGEVDELLGVKSWPASGSNK